MMSPHKVVTEGNNIYRYRSFIEPLLIYEGQGIWSRAKCEGFDDDTAHGDINPATSETKTGL